MAAAVTAEGLEQYRDDIWHRTAARKVTSAADAAAFLREVPFCLAFGGHKAGVPTLWVAACGERDPKWPKHSHSDPAVGLVWGLKETLMHDGVAYYGRIFAGKPSFVARSWLPALLAATPVSSIDDDARAVAEALRDGPLPTAELGRRCGIADKKRLNAALDAAQQAFLVVKTEERSDPFTYVWGALGELYAEDSREADAFDPEIARRKVVRTWVRLLGAVQDRRLARILGWPLEVVRSTVGDLVTSGSVRKDMRIEGTAGEHTVDVEVLERLQMTP